MSKPLTRFPSFKSVSACAAAVVLALGCASDRYHFSQLVGDRFFKTNLDTLPVSITEVDGKSYLWRYPILVDPGARRIVAQGPPTFVDLQHTREILLDIRPCTKYYLVAVKRNRLDNDFELRVDFEEAIAGCTPRRS